MIERHQHGGGVRGATTQPAAHRQPLFDGDLRAGVGRQSVLRLRRLAQRRCRANNQVVVMGDAVDRRSQADAAAAVRRDMQAVAVVEKLKQRLQVMVAVCATAGDIEKQVELCRSGPGGDHCRVQLSIRSLMRWSPSRSSRFAGSGGVDLLS